MVWSIDIRAEGFCSCILIHDELHGISYNYINEKYANEEKWVEIAGYYAPQKGICEDTNILLDIILTFLETGKHSIIGAGFFCVFGCESGECELAKICFEQSGGKR